jgi:hypothetical protein
MEAPHALLLVTPETEFLLRHPRPSSDFESIGFDGLLDSEVYVRKTKSRTDLLATYPAVSGIPTIVVGQAAHTSARTSSFWVVALLHEHFHQMQMSDPGYGSALDALKLARGDTTGKWMLDFPFPYDDPEVGRQLAAAGRTLAAALASSDDSLAARASEYRLQRRSLESRLTRDDFTYLSFQLWQEGVARYTECTLAALAADEHRPSAAFAALEDFRPFADVARAVRTDIDNQLSRLHLVSYKRVAFYFVGAGEALLLDRLRTPWRDRYFDTPFTLKW